MPGYVDTTMNVVHVDDLADGHLRALEDGAQGRSYIIGGENLSMSKLLEMLSGATALPAHDRKFPSSLAVGAAFASDLIQGRILGREPSVPLEAARMSRTHMLYDDSRARDELGYSSRPAIEAVEGSARWFVANGYVSPLGATASPGPHPRPRPDQTSTTTLPVLPPVKSRLSASGACSSPGPRAPRGGGALRAATHRWRPGLLESAPRSPR